MDGEKKTAMGKADKKNDKEYRVIGESFKSREKADMVLKTILKKGFKGSGLMVSGNEFVILFGTFPTERAAKANAEAIQNAGFKASIMENFCG